MFGRVLFAFVCLIIAVGVVLPLYPRDVATSTVRAASDPVQLVAGSDYFGCEDCPVADAGGTNCHSGCPCGEVLPTAGSVEDPLGLTVFVVVNPQPSASPSGPQPLPPKLPAI